MTDNRGSDDMKDGKRLGFQFKGSSKRQKIVEGEKQVEVDIITSIEGSNIDSVMASKENEVLVIPLIQPKFHADTVSQAPTKAVTIKAEPSGSSKSKDATAALTLDQIAAAELISDLQNGDNDTEDAANLLVIKQAASAEPASSSDAAGAKKKAPLLMLNVAPELLNIANESERFKYDVSSRAEDLNVRSEIYDAIPVGQFGAALLRGMGWAGPDKEDKNKKEEKIVAREHRLGLGAQAKPPDRPKHKSNAVVEKVHSEQDSRRSKDIKKWEARAEERLAGQRLQDGDMVWLRAPAELSGKRAVVITAKGVPGLDRVRIQLEHSGRILEVGRKDCVLLSSGELEDAPFVFAANHVELRDEAVGKHQQTQYSGMKDSAATSKSTNSGTSSSDGRSDGRSTKDGSGREHQTSSGHGSSSSSNGDGNRKYDRLSANESKQDSADQDHKNPKQGGSSYSSSGNNNTGKPAAPPQQVYWLREGIRVKIVSKSIGGSKAYLQKGTVLDVYARGQATVRLDDRTVLDKVNERHVETIVPSVGGMCVVLLGEYKGQQATLLEKKGDEQRVVVQLSEDLEVVELDMDFISALSNCNYA